jgi:hypothetical protein
MLNLGFVERTRTGVIISHDSAAHGHRVRCPTCQTTWVFVNDEAEGSSWEELDDGEPSAAAGTDAPGAHCSFEVLLVERGRVTIRDLHRGKSAKDDAVHVVRMLCHAGLLQPGRRLFYCDSADNLVEIIWDDDGAISFEPGQ